MSKKLKFNILATLDQLGVDHRDVVDPNRRKFLIRSIQSSTALSAEMKFSLITGIMTLFAPKKAFSQLIPFAFWKNGGPPVPTLQFPTQTAGPLFTWGRNFSGELGTGNRDYASEPVQIEGLWKQSMGGYTMFSAGIREDDTLWMWGDGAYGNLARETNTNDYSSPVQVAGTWQWISESNRSVAAIKPDNTMYMWGRNSGGQLGLGDTDGRSSPVQLSGQWSFADGNRGLRKLMIKPDYTLWVTGSFLLGIGSYGNRSSPVQLAGSWVQGSIGWNHGMAIRTDGSLWVWGNNGDGQLGLNNTSTYTSPVQLTGSWKQVVAGWHFSLGIRSDDTLWGWGYNRNGRLAQSSYTDFSSPVQIFGSWKQITAGDEFAMGRKMDDSLWTWGRNNMGQLGQGNTTTNWSPQQIEGTFTSVSAGRWHATAIGQANPIAPTNDTQGTLWSWGEAGNGRLGLGNTTYYSSPVQASTEYWLQVAATNYATVALRNDKTMWSCGANPDAGLSGFDVFDLTKHDGSWKMISGGIRHHLAVNEDGTLWVWGYNSNGQLGVSGNFHRSSPIQVGSDTNWSYVGAGGNHSFAIKTDGTLWAWGYNGGGQLAQGTHLNNTSSPVQVGSESNWIKISASAFGALGLQSDGTLWGWGDSGNGELGQGDEVNRSSPIQLSGTWIDMAAGKHTHALGLRSDNTLWAWGRNHYGQLGNDSTTNFSSPIQVTSYKFKAIAGGRDSGLAIREDGTFWVWGRNHQGQLGLGDEDHRSLPVQLGTDNDWVSVSGYDHTLAIKGVTQGGSGGASLSFPSQLLATPGYLWGVGYNGSGELGLADNITFYSSPVQISGLWIGFSFGYEHALAIKADNTLWAWGSDGTEGKLGQITAINTESSPVQIAGSWIAMSAGHGHSLAIKSDNTLWSWGNGDSGRTGQGGTPNSSSPVQLAGEWVQATAGHTASGAIKSDGTLWMWGRNNDGQLGDNSISIRMSPVQVGSDTDWTYVKNGTYMTIALKSDNTLWTWGFNNYGQLGDGSTNHRSSPVQIDGSWVQVATGIYTTAAIRTDGTMWVWGENSGGSLAQNDTNDRSSPIQIPGSWLQVAGAGLRPAPTGRPGFKAIRNDGTVWAWGRNPDGMLGIENITNFSSPVQVGADNDHIFVEGSLGYNTWTIRYAQPRKAYSLWTWGTGWAGMLGQVTNADYKSSPVQIPGEWTKVATAAYQTFALKEDGSLWFWGYSKYGEGGFEPPGNSHHSSPVQIPGTWIDCSAAVFTGFGIKEDGTLWAWGRGFTGGLLCQPDLISRSSPVQIGSDKFWRKLPDGGRYSMGAIRDDGTLWTWGGAYVGDGTGVNRSSPVQVFGGGQWKSLTIGFSNAMGIKTNGTLWGWGYNNFGAISQDAGSKNSPVQWDSNTWKSVSIRGNNTIAIRSDDKIFVWGRNGDGQLGLGTATLSEWGPNQLSGIAKAVGTGVNTTHFVKSDGGLWGTGDNDNGQIGDGTVTDRSSPVQIGTEADWVQVYGASYGHTIGFRDTIAPTGYEMWVWGRNADGQLGLGDATGRDTPTLASGKWAAAFKVGYRRFALGTDGVLTACGQGDYGILTTGSTANQSSPVMVSSYEGWKYIDGGYHHILGLKKDGTLWTWGNNNVGQLGLNNITNYSSPVQISGGWIDVAGKMGGGASSFGIRDDGTLWSWGDNSFGSLGQSFTTNVSSPVQIGSDSDWVKVKVGDRVCMALKSDGTLWSWGRNTNGCLGDGTTASRSSPVQVSVGGTILNFHCGRFSSAIIDDQNRLWTVGRNTNGTLGVNNTTDYSSPVQVAGSWVAVTGNSECFIATQTDGTLWSWGPNWGDQLGRPGAPTSSSPVQVGTDTDWAGPVGHMDQAMWALKKKS